MKFTPCRARVERRKLEIQREVAEAAKRGDDARIEELDTEKLRLSKRADQLDAEKRMSNTLK